MSKRLVIYLMAEPETPELAKAAVDGGADIVELGHQVDHEPLAHESFSNPVSASA